MTNLNDIRVLKSENANKLENVVSKHVQSLKSSPEWVEIIGKLIAFESDAYDTKKYNFEFDDFGMLNACLDLDIPRAWHDNDSDVLDAIADTLQNEIGCMYFRANHNDSTIRVENCLGDATTINEGAYRNEYYIRSSELGLKLTKKDVESTEQGLYLIECAMRKAGVFGNVVEVDANGYFYKFTDTGLGRLSDDELAKYGEQFEGARDE